MNYSKKYTIDYRTGLKNKTVSCFGVRGSTGYYAVEGSVLKEGGISTWVIVGIVGGIVLILLCIKLAQEAEESCGYCSGLGLGDSSPHISPEILLQQRIRHSHTALCSLVLP